MWFQRKVRGELATVLITPVNGAALARRIAEAAVKIHRAAIPTSKVHTIHDELRILKECFATLSRRSPHLSQRLEKLLAGCARISAGLEASNMVGIHRDFYSDQILVHHDRLFVLDFDLYCQGDPALDIGNFIGHLTEQALRVHGESTALLAAEAAMEERFLELSGAEHRRALHVYSNLTLSRHIFLSSQFAERAHLTESLLSICEQRIQ
jgi:aminoglycoside phosphotransferase (APT) family kinase protein